MRVISICAYDSLISKPVQLIFTEQIGESRITYYRSSLHRDSHYYRYNRILLTRMIQSQPAARSTALWVSSSIARTSIRTRNNLIISVIQGKRWLIKLIRIKKIFQITYFSEIIQSVAYLFTSFCRNSENVDVPELLESINKKYILQRYIRT